MKIILSVKLPDSRIPRPGIFTLCTIFGKIRTRGAGTAARCATNKLHIFRVCQCEEYVREGRKGRCSDKEGGMGVNLKRMWFMGVGPPNS